MISIMHNQHWTPGKTGLKLGLEPLPGHGGLYEAGVVLGIVRIGETCGGKGPLALEKSGRGQPSVVRAVIEVG